MEDHVIAINFCGGCNPIIDRGEIALEIGRALAAEGFAVVFNDWDAGFIVRLSGCRANCAARYHPVSRPDAVISGPSFGALAVEETELAGRAIAAARAHFRTKPNGAPLSPTARPSDPRCDSTGVQAFAAPAETEEAR